jgi:hypothetical protein
MLSARLHDLEKDNIGLKTELATLEGLVQSGRELDQARLGGSRVLRNYVGFFSSLSCFLLLIQRDH